MSNTSSKPGKGPRCDSSKETFWRKMLAENAAGGQGVRAFCRQRGLTQPSFYACRRAIAQRDRKTACPPGARHPRFVELCTPQPMRGRDDAPLEIVAGNSRLLIRPAPRKQVPKAVENVYGKCIQIRTSRREWHRLDFSGFRDPVNSGGEFGVAGANRCRR